MTFSSEKNKIFKIWNGSISNQFQVTILNSNDNIILSNVKELNNRATVYKNLINLSSDWLTPETIVRNKGGEDEFIWKMFKEYSLEINSINKNLIPYIKSKVSYRLGDGVVSTPIPDAPLESGIPFDEEATLEINDVVSIKDILGNFNKNIIYRSSVSLTSFNSLPSELQFKFYINIFNPNYYQST